MENVWRIVHIMEMSLLQMVHIQIYMEVRRYENANLFKHGQRETLVISN